MQAAQIAGGLYVWRNVVQSAASFPVGMLADRVGALRILVLGYALGAMTGLLMAITFWLHVNTLALLAAVFLLAGLYTAVQEALEPTVIAEMVSADTLAMSIGALGTTNGTAKFISSAGVGLIWSALSPVLGFAFATITMAAGTVMLARLRHI